MAPRYDKYDPISGGFRAKLNADLTFDGAGSVGPKVVSLNATGKVVIGTAGQSGFCGVLVKAVPMTPSLGNIAGTVNAAVPIGGKAGDVVDIMTAGEIVDVTGLAAGTRYFAKSDGTLSALSSDGPYVGFTVEATRLVVRTVGAPIGNAV
jgi:hypothetical protein